MSSTPATVPLRIQWGKDAFDVDLDVNTGVPGLYRALHAQTGVPMDRMKVLVKTKAKGLWKGVLKDNADLTAMDWNNAAVAASSVIATASSKGQQTLQEQALSPQPRIQLLLMGSAAQLTGPKEKTVFVEDLPPEELAKVAEPAGLVNLGNTCYLNSVVQCLRVIPALRQGIRRLSSSSSSSSNGNSYRSFVNAASASSSSSVSSMFMESLRFTYDRLDNQVDAVQPTLLVHATRQAFPQFAQSTRGPQGQTVMQQQDAEEFYSSVLTLLADATRGIDYIRSGLPNVHSDTADLMGAENLVDALFGIKMKDILTCDEFTTTNSSSTATTNDDDMLEPPVVSYDLHRKLVCNIQGGSDSMNNSNSNNHPQPPSSSSTIVNVNYLAEGIHLSMSGKIQKHSTVLNRDSIWTRTQRIARLPPVLVVQFGRFYWKATPDSEDHAGVKCKVMKPVTFHSTLDVFEFCTPEIQKVLKVARDKALAAEEDRIAKKLKGELLTSPEPMEVDDHTAQEEEDATELQAALALSLGEPDAAGNTSQPQPPTSIGPGLPTDFQGIYELFAVVTHKGRDADGGHYMAWVKANHQNGSSSSNNSSSSSRQTAQKIADTNVDNEDWFVFDDDEVSPCKTEDILKLKGGGDWHMSYLNFYRFKK